MSVDFSWNTATSVPLLNLTREERAFGWPVFFSLKRIALLQHPDLDPAEPGNWRVRKSQDVLEQALRQAVLSGSLDAIAKAKLVEQDSVAWGDDGVQRIVQGTRTVETHEIAALALLNWFNEQDITPSEHMRAWFDATGASFAVLWKEKNEKYMHPGKEADRFAERNFLEGYEDVTNKLHRGTENSPFDHGEPSPDRCAELARLPSLDAEDWIELTGVGLGKVGHYIVSIEGVRFSEWPEEMIKEVATTEGQRQMLRDNKTPALSFPCSTDELMLFVDSETADGTRFDLPEAFRLARSELQVKTGLGESLSSLESKKSSVQEKTEVDVSTVRSPAKRRRGRKPSAAPVLLDGRHWRLPSADSRVCRQRVPHQTAAFVWRPSSRNGQRFGRTVRHGCDSACRRAHCSWPELYRCDARSESPRKTSKAARAACLKVRMGRYAAGTHILIESEGPFSCVWLKR